MRVFDGLNVIMGDVLSLRVVGRCVASVVVMVVLWLFQLVLFSEIVVIVVIIEVGLVLALACVYIMLGMVVRSALVLAFSILMATIVLLRFLTPHYVCSQFWVEARSLKSLEEAMWSNTAGRIVLMGVTEDGLFPEPIIFSSKGLPLTKDELRQLMCEKLNRKILVGYRFGYFDFTFRATGVHITIVQ